jgi:hypothetical protein
MAGTRQAEQSRPRIRRGLLLLAATLCALALIAPAAGASSPLHGEYSLNAPSAGGGPKPPSAEKSSAVPVGSSQGDSAVPALLIGLAAIGSAGAGFAYLRRRRSGQTS